LNEIEDLIKKAKRYIESAELLLLNRDFDSSVSRGYYAMFFMAEACLLMKGLKSSSHKGVISLFREHFIEAAVFKEEIGTSLKKGYDSEQKGDYSTGFFVSEKEAKERLKDAKYFIVELEKFLKQNKKTL
jgi:uncharacterized protein (UPF0332 family)